MGLGPLFLYLAPVGTLWPVPNILLGDTFPYGCGSGGYGAPGVSGTVYPDLGSPVIPGTFCHLSFDHNLGCSRDRNDLDCSLSLASSYGLCRTPLVFCRHTGYRVPADIVPLLVASCSGAQYAGMVSLVDLTDCTHTGPWCVTGNGTSCTVSALYILM